MIRIISNRPFDSSIFASMPPGMIKNGPIVIVENDLEDQDVITHVLHLLQIKNELNSSAMGLMPLIFCFQQNNIPF